MGGKEGWRGEGHRARSRDRSRRPVAAGAQAPATYEHQVEAASLAIALEREFAPDRVVTEREIRSLDTGRERPELAVRLPGAPRGRYPRLHFPDLAVLGADERGRPLAVELERSVKARARLRAIVRAYVGARHVAGARYYADGAAERAVRAAVEEARAQAVVELRRMGTAEDISPGRHAVPGRPPRSRGGPHLPAPTGQLLDVSAKGRVVGRRS